MVVLAIFLQESVICLQFANLNLFGTKRSYGALNVKACNDIPTSGRCECKEWKSFTE